MQCFCPPYLADDDSIRPQADGMAEQCPDRYLADALGVWRPSLKTDDVAIQAQLCGVLHGHGAFLGVDLSGQHVEQGGLPGACASGHQEVHPVANGLPEKGGTLIVDAPCGNQAVEVFGPPV